MNKIKCFIKAIICCIFPKKTKYYKHSKSLVDVEPEYLILSENDEELIVPTEQYKRMMNELEKCIIRR